MRFPKTLTYCCVLAVGTAVVCVAQTDAEQQDKALNALRQFTAEKEGQASRGLTTRPVQESDDAAITKELEQKAREAISQQEQAPQTEEKPVVVPTAAPTATTTTSTQESSIDTNEERTARGALDELRRADAPVAEQQSVTAKTSPGNPANQETAVRAALDESYTSVPTDNTLSPGLEGGARATLESMASGTAVATSGQSAVMAKPKPMTRKEKLNDLLEQYMDNTITPREYHQQRATIIAGN